MTWTVSVNEEELKAAEEGQNDFKPLEKGWYEVFITGVDTEIVSSVKGTPGLEVVFTVRDDVEQAGKRKKVWETLWISEKAMIRVQKLLKAVGRGSGQASKEEMTRILMGKSLQIEVTQEEYTKKDNTTGIKNLVTFLGFKESLVGGTAPVEEDTREPFVVTDDMLPF